MTAKGDGLVNLSDWLASFLFENQVSQVFHLSGGMTTFMVDAIYRKNQIQIINTKHEQAAGFAAEGQGRITNTPGVAFATSGPGATNLITAIGSAFFDSTPLVLITGQVNSKEIRSNPKQRQNGFQELDICSMVSGITKKAVQLDSAQNFPTIFSELWDLATSGRPGPVLIDIPIDLQQQSISRTNPATQLANQTRRSVPIIPIAKIRQRIEISQRPLILAGGGIRTSNQIDNFRNLVERWKIPVVHSLMATDVLPSDHPNRVGLIGSYGNRWANKALAECDLLISLGSRLDVRQTGSNAEEFIQDKYIIRFDNDPEELLGRIKANENFEIDLQDALNQLHQIQEIVERPLWRDLISKNRWKFPAENEQESDLQINPNILIENFSRKSIDVQGYVVDVGQHQMWAAQSVVLTKNQRFLTSGGMGAMGFALPTAIGAQLKTKGKWIVISGDGCAQLTIPEFQTIRSLSLDLTILIFNNHQHGMVAQFQESNLDSRFVGTRIGYDTPDFVKVATSFGIPSTRVTTYLDFQNLETFFENHPQGPTLIEIEIPVDAKALPKMDHTMNLKDL